MAGLLTYRYNYLNIGIRAGSTTIEKGKGSDVVWDPGQIAEASTYPLARVALDSLYRRNRETFERLFLLERFVHLPKSIADPLLTAGLIVGDCGQYRSRVRIWVLDRRYYASDPCTSKLGDRVYPVYQDQGAFFAERLAVKPGDEVLDIGTGTGVLAIEAARTAGMVTGIDVNPRATSFARANASLNGASNVRFRTGDLLEESSSLSRHDLVLCNPPFTAVPEPAAWFTHGSAGFDGLDVFRRFLTRLPALVSDKGRLQLLLNSLGTATTVQALDLVRESFPSAGLDIHHLFDPPSAPIDDYTIRFAGSPAYEEWREWLKSNGFTHVYRMLITVDLASPGRFVQHPSPRYRFAIVEPFGEQPQVYLADSDSGGWREMLLRYGARTASD